MKKSLCVFSLFCLLLIPNAFALEEAEREKISINWEKDVFDMHQYADSYVREYDYCFFDYFIKDNAAESIWTNQIITIMYKNPDYVAIHEVHNYFIITHYFSNTPITYNRSQQGYFVSPYMPGGDIMLYINRYNANLEKIRLLLAEKPVISEEKRNADYTYLDESRIAESE
jgi:hypothetical protein